MNEKEILQKISSAAEIQQPPVESIPPEIPAQIAAPTPQTEVMPQVQEMGNVDAIKNTAAKDIQIVQNLMRSGILNPVQGQHLMNYVLTKASEAISSQKQQTIAPANAASVVSGISQFEQENPGFFKQNGRNQVLEYLKTSNAVVDKDELTRISQMVAALEQSAIDGYLQKQSHAKSLNDENEAAKKKLRANAQNSNSSDANTRVFTREQIGRMSGAEFAKNERIIMEQLRKGLIR